MACRPPFGTIWVRQRPTIQPEAQHFRCSNPRISPAKTAPVQHAPQQAAVPASPAAPALIASFECSSQPPYLKCCDDRLNPPPAFPARWFYGLYVISPGTGLSCSRRLRGHYLASLASASGGQNHTTSPSAEASVVRAEFARRPSASIAFRLTFGDDWPQRPFQRGGTMRTLLLNTRNNQAIYFFATDWTNSRDCAAICPSGKRSPRDRASQETSHHPTASEYPHGEERALARVSNHEAPIRISGPHPSRRSQGAVPQGEGT